MEIVALSSESVRGDCGAGVSPALESRADGTSAPQDRTWHDELRLAIRDPAELIAAVQLPAAWVEPARRAAQSFPVFAPSSYVARMSQGNPADPLLRQVLPLADERVERSG